MIKKNIDKYNIVTVSGTAGSGKSFLLADFAVFLSKYKKVTVFDSDGDLQKKIQTHPHLTRTKHGLSVFQYRSLDKIKDVTSGVVIIDGVVCSQELCDLLRKVTHKFDQIIVGVQARRDNTPSNYLLRKNFELYDIQILGKTVLFEHNPLNVRSMAFVPIYSHLKSIYRSGIIDTILEEEKEL